MNVDDLAFGPNVLLPVVVQHHRSGQVLMVGFADREAVQRTLDTRHAWFFSRSRQRLWEKGETSGNYLLLKSIRVDCDADALVYACEPAGPTCHTGQPSCFYRSLEGAPPEESLGEAVLELWDTIRQRQAAADVESSYVARLLAQGVDRGARKVGEEATEVVIAAKNDDRAELVREVADLWFHTFVLLAQQGVSPDEVWAELRGRRRG